MAQKRAVAIDAAVEALRDEPEDLMSFFALAVKMWPIVEEAAELLDVGVEDSRDTACVIAGFLTGWAFHVKMREREAAAQEQEETGTP